MKQCPSCGYLIPQTWSTCKRCAAPASAPETAGDKDPFAYSAPARWSPDEHAVSVRLTAPEMWWRRPAMSLGATAVGFVLVLASAFALPWMHVGGGFVHFDLTYKQMQDLLSSTDFFSRVALDLGPVILLADLLVVGWSLATRGRIGAEGVAAPIGLACLVLYVSMQIHSFGGTVNNDAFASALGLHAGTGPGPWVCLLGCACLVVGALTGASATAPVPRRVATHVARF
jgi:hypothetical protein